MTCFLLNSVSFQTTVEMIVALCSKLGFGLIYHRKPVGIPMDLNTQKCRKFFFWHEQDDINIWVSDRTNVPKFNRSKFDLFNLANQSAHLQSSFSTYEYNFLIIHQYCPFILVYCPTA